MRFLMTVNGGGRPPDEGNITLTDGPFTESKAVELARRFWQVVGDGEGDIRQVFGPED